LKIKIEFQDFTYVENYLQKFVLAPTALHGNGGAGLERHDFHHLVNTVIPCYMLTICPF